MILVFDDNTVNQLFGIPLVLEFESGELASAESFPRDLDVVATGARDVTSSRSGVGCAGVSRTGPRTVTASPRTSSG